jgi:two-component system KDP operon response regulator KdpE
LTKEIRARSVVPIIVLSVRNQDAAKVSALDEGADDYITKPFSMPELLARIRAALRRLPQKLEDNLETVKLADVEINMKTRRVTAGSKVVRLTPKEFDLLQYFLAHPNEPIAHGSLLQAVWGPDYGDEVEYLRVFVNQLRKKIEPDPSNPRYLLTDPWVGYRFQLPDSEDKA